MGVYKFSAASKHMETYGNGLIWVSNIYWNGSKFIGNGSKQAIQKLSDRSECPGDTYYNLKDPCIYVNALKIK